MYHVKKASESQISNINHILDAQSQVNGNVAP